MVASRRPDDAGRDDGGEAPARPTVEDALLAWDRVEAAERAFLASIGTGPPLLVGPNPEAVSDGDDFAPPFNWSAHLAGQLFPLGGVGKLDAILSVLARLNGNLCAVVRDNNEAVGQVVLRVTQLAGGVTQLAGGATAQGRAIRKVNKAIRLMIERLTDDAGGDPDDPFGIDHLRGGEDDNV